MKLQAARALMVGLVVSATLVASQAASSPAKAVTTVASTPVPSDGTDERVKAVARVGDRVYIGGDFTTVAGQPHSGLAALDASTGRLITTWRSDVGGGVNTLAPSSDGTLLYVGGDFTTIGGVTRRHLAAVSISTGAVGAWNPNAVGGTVLALAVSGSRVYVGGKFTSIGSTWRPRLAAVTTTGALDPAFDARVDDVVWALGLSVDHTQLYAGGYFRNIGGQFRAHLAALDPFSGNASNWRPQLGCPVLGLAAGSSAVYVACGGGPSQGNRALAFSTSSDAQLWVAHSDGNVVAVALLGGVVYAGGHFSTVNGVPQKKAAAFDAASGQELPWNPRPNSALGVRCLLADGTSLWMGGDFTTISGVSQPHLALFR